MFNINAHVGVGQRNLLDDVEFSRMAYTAIGRDSLFKIDDALRATIASLNPIGPFGPDLDAVIKAHERSRGGAQDGRVSPLPENTAALGGHYDRKHGWIVMALNTALRDVYEQQFPRLDLVPGCGASLVQAMRSLFGASS